jgi:hypothetical protein
MAVGYYFAPPTMSTAQYDECIKQLEAAGAGAPAGRLYHVCFKVDGALRVFDVWDSQESFDKFGQTLMPILQGLGADPGTPTISEIHNIIEG